MIYLTSEKMAKNLEKTDWPTRRCAFLIGLINLGFSQEAASWQSPGNQLGNSLNGESSGTHRGLAFVKWKEIMDCSKRPGGWTECVSMQSESD